VEAALASIDATLPFEGRLLAAVDILRARVAQIFRVMAADAGRRRAPTRVPELRELVALFERERDRLRCPPAEAAQLLRGLTFSGTHPSFVVNEALESAEIVSVLLDGIRSKVDRGRSC